MIKYVLNSGGFRDKPIQGRDFVTEIISGHGNKPKILISIFAETRETWQTRYQKTTDRFTEFLPPEIEPVYEMASDDDFENQVMRNDIVFFYGGDVEVLAGRLQKFDILNIFEGKTIAGTSAGSAVWGQAYWEPYTPAIRSALGIIPMKFIPHFGAGDKIDWDQVLQELQSHGDQSLEIHAMPEGDYVVIHQ